MRDSAGFSPDFAGTCRHRARRSEATENLRASISTVKAAHLFSLLADPTRLILLCYVDAAGPISVSDLAAASGIADTSVSQTLRYLKANQTVVAERDGRVMRYRIAEPAVARLLADLRPSSEAKATKKRQAR